MEDMNLNEMRKSITSEIARMRKSRLSLVMYKELGEMLLKKMTTAVDGGETIFSNNIIEEVRAKNTDIANHISELDDMIRMGEMALKIHEIIDEEEE